MFEYINNIEFDITGKCNLNCKYCYLGERDQGDMDEEVINQFIFNFFSEPHTNKNLSISFWGGEPFINFFAIRNIVDRFEQKKAFINSINYRIITNGTIISDHIIEFLKKHNISLQITIDGCESHHDSMRCDEWGNGSFQKIIDNLNTLKNCGINYDIRTTLTSAIGLLSCHSYIDG